MPPKQDETKTEETKTEETKTDETNTDETNTDETKEEENIPAPTINDIKPNPNNLDSTLCHYTYRGTKYNIPCNKLIVKENDEYEGNIFPRFKTDYNGWRNAYKNGDLKDCYTTDISGGNPDLPGDLKYKLKHCPEFTDFYKKTSLCKKAEKERPGFTPYIGSTRDSDLQIFVKMFITVICTTILFLIFVAMACASWVNTYKVSYNLFPPKDAFSGEDADAKKKKKTMECTDTSKYPYVGTKEEAKPGREYDCNQIKDYFRVSFLHDFIEKKLYSKLVPSKLLIKSLSSFGKEYKNPDGSDNIDKYKAEHIKKILSDPKNIPKFDPKILYHFWKEKMIPEEKSKMIQIFEKDMPPPKDDIKDLLVKNGDIEQGENTNDPYDIDIGDLYKKLEEAASANAEKNGGDDAGGDDAGGDDVPEGLPDAAKAAISQGDGGKSADEIKIEKKIEKIKKWRKNLLKHLKKKVKIGGNISIPKNKWHSLTGSKTFKVKILAVTALILQCTLLIWRTLHNLYMTILAKITKNPEGKGGFGKGVSFLLHFIVANPVFIGAMASFFGTLSTTFGILWGIGKFFYRLNGTKNVKNLETGKDKFLWGVHMCISLLYNIIMFVIGAVVFAIILPYLLLFFPYHHAMTLMGSLRKASEPDISIAETIHKNVCRGVSMPFIIVLAGIMSVLFSEKRRYVPCVAGPMSEVNYQNMEFSDERQQDSEMKDTLNNDALNNFKEKRSGNRNELFSTVLIATAILILGYKKIMG